MTILSHGLRLKIHTGKNGEKMCMIHKSTHALNKSGEVKKLSEREKERDTEGINIDFL